MLPSTNLAKTSPKTSKHHPKNFQKPPHNFPQTSPELFQHCPNTFPKLATNLSRNQVCSEELYKDAENNINTVNMEVLGNCLCFLKLFVYCPSFGSLTSEFYFLIRLFIDCITDMFSSLYSELAFSGEMFGLKICVFSLMFDSPGGFGQIRMIHFHLVSA